MLQELPKKIYLGQQYNFHIEHLFTSSMKENDLFFFIIPEFQRSFVWTQEQQVRFIDSIFRGIPLGTYSYTKNNFILLDGQQRITTIYNFINNKFQYMGRYFKDLTEKELFDFKMTIFPAYVSNNETDDYMKNYYDLMNFGGTPHDR